MGQEGLFDLSPSQEIVWVHERLSPGSRAYNFTAFVVVRGDLDADAVHEALGHVLDHHDGLRLELTDTPDARPAQRVRDRCRPRFRTVDISGETDVEAAFDEVVRAEATTSFDTYEAPLVRWCLVRTGTREHRLIHVEHHLIHDGRSFLILVGDLFRAYRALVAGEPVELPATVPYTEHLRRVAAVPPGERAESLAFWHRELADATFEATLPGLARPGAVRRNHGAQHRQRFAPEVADRIRARSVASGHTVYTTLLGLFAELVRRHCGQDDLIVGTAVGNRYDEVDTSVGMFVNTIPLRLRLSGETPVDDVLSDVTETLIRAIPHQDVPIQQLTREIGRHTSGVENPLFNIAFSGVDDTVPDVRVPGLDVVLSEGHNFGTTRFDLDLVLIPDARRVVGPRVGPAAIDLHWDYDADLFSAETVRLLADRLAALVEAYLDAPPTAPVASLAAAPPPVVDDAAAGETPCHPVVSGVLLPAGRDPEAVAVVSGARTLTYRDLDARVGRVASALTAAGVDAGQPVAVLLPRGVDVVVALLACARVGAVYCPMSATDPAERLRLLLDRLRPALVLTDAATAGRLPAVPAPLAVLDGDRWPAARPAVSLDGVAYVIHTSGSTGVPKPVAVGRAALSHLVDAIVGRYALGPADRVLMFTQPHFDVALEEILPTLAVGARLVVPQSEVLGGPELVAVSAARQVTVANLPTSYVLTVAPELAAAWRDRRWRPRLLVVGGEAVTGESLRDLVGAGTTTVLNAYGVTEATVTSTVHEVTGADLATTATVPLGTDLPGTRTYVVDRSGWPLPDGAVGEIAVAGAGLARGYPHDEAATAGAFPRVDALGGQRVYRTGDRGYRDTAGRLHFAGRLDDQVKFRGYRIEPGEVRSVLVEHPQVRDAYVQLTAGQDTGEAQLVAYVEPVGDAPAPGELRAFLAGRLPAHLVPSAFVPVPKLPRTPVGKIRRDELPPVVATVIRPDVPLASDREEQIARVWREVLGVDRVGRTDNFFDLGGHSLLLLRVHARLVRELRLDLPVVTLFRYPTVEAIAAHLAGADGAPSGRPDLGQARLAGRDRLTRARARRGGTDDQPQEAVPLDETGTQP
ncbi:non-ribosomal peptide synthetase [Micromonospora sagamiensis]|uniref:Amino acid adenylation domain-containing protein n=1 Tax=Micromonospora sagamiensis TaxID=47875 RepID=A0A562WHX8_9ACTN|nr:non-ribosomal peptide synthetase [Micromonospora sagamiensis]TWJ29631.1 amino acid adenylation domain-containing protein [Micromonospora sagamiensis]BCL17337.1 hypothetical protein GCM10017556_50760 [Micromonospora sagamiensis]